MGQSFEEVRVHSAPPPPFLPTTHATVLSPAHARSSADAHDDELRSASPSRASRRRVPERLRRAAHPTTPRACR
jgi:hypothetical protein